MDFIHTHTHSRDKLEGDPKNSATLINKTFSSLSIIYRRRKLSPFKKIVNHQLFFLISHLTDGKVFEERKVLQFFAAPQKKKVFPIVIIEKVSSFSNYTPLEL